MEEQFSGSCTLEIAAFDEFARLLGDRAGDGRLRPRALRHRPDRPHAAAAVAAVRLGRVPGRQHDRHFLPGAAGRAAGPAETLRRHGPGPGRSRRPRRWCWSARPEAAALREAERTSGELAALGVRNQHLVINGVFRATDRDDPVAVAMEQRGREAARRRSRPGWRSLPRTHDPAGPARPARDRRPAGVRRRSRIAAGREPVARRPGRCHRWRELIDELARAGRGVILTMGKGGVGKTTVAAAIAVALADRGFPVHLTTTDPAAHVAATVNGELPNLTVSRIDPKAETAAYSAEVMAHRRGRTSTRRARRMLEEDLRSPCTEEIAVFRAFAAGGRGGRGRLRRARHRPDRPHDPAARRGPGLPPRGDPAGQRDARGGREAAAAAARPGVHAAC